AYLRLRAEEPWALPYFILSMALLYHSHYGAFFPTLAALAAHLFLFKPWSELLHRFLFALVVIAVLVLPWVYFMRVWNRGQEFLLDRFLAHLGQYALFITIWIFPLILMPPLLVAWLRRSRGNGFALSATQADFCEVAGSVILLTVPILSASAAYDWVFFRYILHLVPLLLVLLAIVVVLIMEWRFVLGAVVLVMLVTTNALHVLPYIFPGVRYINWQNVWPSSEALVHGKGSGSLLSVFALMFSCMRSN
ncbi:MAG: hypothetical protein ACPLRM_05975, partial [Anaerolineae bacterium]